MDKKEISANTIDAADSYWLACIAHHNSLDNQADCNPSERTPKAAAVEGPVTTHHPRHPADSFWLKKPQAVSASPSFKHAVTDAPVEAGQGLSQGDARAGIPDHIPYSAIIDDGSTHHVVWSVSNMSLSGVLLAMDITHLRLGMTVDFLLRYTHKGKAMDHRIPAKVVRTRKNGLALQFGRYDISTCHDLAGMLYSG